MVLPVEGVHCIPGVKYLSLVGTIDQSVGASTSTGSLTGSVPSSSEGSVNTFQAGCVELLSEFNKEDNLPASETQFSSTEFNATLTQVKAKMLAYNVKQARDIAAGRRRRVHEVTSKAFTGFSNDCLLLPSPPVLCTGNRHRSWEIDSESAESLVKRRRFHEPAHPELPMPPPPFGQAITRDVTRSRLLPPPPLPKSPLPPWRRRWPLPSPPPAPPVPCLAVVSRMRIEFNCTPRRQDHVAGRPTTPSSKASTRFSNDRLPWLPPPVPLAGNSYRFWEFDWEFAEHPVNRRGLPQPPPPPSRPW